MSNKPIKNEKFLQDQVNKLQIELTKFIIDTNYSNSYSLSLRQKLSSFESKLQKQIQTQRKANTQKVKQISTYLPQILSTVHPNIIQAPNSLYNIKTRTSNQIMSITKQIPKVEEDKKDDLFRPVKSSPKAFSVGKFIKYSSERKGQSLYHSRIYDTHNYPIIRNKEMKQGLLDLINQGLIPKIADLSPAFQKNGNPVNISSKSVKLNYTKQHSRDEVPDSPSKINSIKYDIKEEFIPEEKLLEKKKKSNLFLTANNESKTSEELHSIFFGSMDSGNNAYQVQSNSAEDIKEDKNDYYLNLTNETDDKDKLLITFNNFTLIKNEPYSKFVRANKAIRNKILFMVDNISSMLKKLDLNGEIRADTNKILYLLTEKPKLPTINNQDLIFCITSSDLIKNGFDVKNELSFIEKIREILVIKIQKKIRQFFAKKRLKYLQFENSQIVHIQAWYRLMKTRREVQKDLLEIRQYKKETFTSIQSSFRDNWDASTDLTKIEIHINSLSYSNYKNTTIDKYPEKENLQLNRLIRLIDPNVEMIYISPYEISDDILKYYFSILNTIGISNIENRFHLIVPEYAKYFPPHYSLSQLLYFSSKTQQKIKKIINERNAYIIPGMVSKLEEEIAFILECPILMGDFDQVDLIFNKSGAKSAFEINELAFPISAWDIKTEEEFYSSLAHLIAMYPTINVWLFKINKETNGRGIAYLELSKIDKLTQLKQEKNTNPDFTINLLKEKLFYFLSANLKNFVKIAYPTIYPTWNEYLKEYTKQKGIIESCPTFDLSGIMGSPSLPILIEPSGKIKVLPTYDKINVEFFKNIGCISPQKSLLDVDMNAIGEKIGTFLYGQNIIGYVTIEFITFHDGKKILYWGIDLKYGLTDHITSLQYCYFLYIQSVLHKDSESTESENNDEYDLDYGRIISNALAFSIPYISNSSICELLLKDFLSGYRFESLVFDLTKKEGVIFNLPDTLQCGVFGLCGVVNLDKTERKKADYSIWNMMERSMRLLLGMINKTNKNKRIYGKGDIFGNNAARNDAINIQLIYSKIKVIAKQKGKVFEDEKKALHSNNAFLK